MAVQINVAANQAALTASIQAGVQAYNQRFAQNNQLNLTINPRAFSQPLGRITGDVKDFEAALAASNARVIAFGASTAVLGGVIRSFKELANVTIEVEKNLADINRVFGLTTSQLQKFSTDLFNVTKQTASSFNDASQAALEFSRQGLKAEETLQRTKDALTLTRLAGISTANAVDALTSTVNGFSATGVTTTQILNKLVAVEQDFAVGAGDLAEALSRTGQAAQEAGVSLDQLNALVTSAQQSTARGGAVIGNALKTIFTRLQRTDTLDQLEAFNIAVRDVQGNILPAVTILQNFAGAYKGLADAQKAQLSEQVAGVYQVNILKAIVNDLNKSQGVYAGALQRGAMATNEAEVATAKLNQTLDALLKQTATSTQQLANNIGKVTFEPLARYGTEQLKSLVESMNEILEGEGIGSTFANGLLKGIRNILAGPGAIAAFFTLFKLIQNSFTYLSQALPQIAGITTETQNRKNIESAILQIMAQQGTVAQALDGLTGNQVAQANLLLQTARAQTAEYQRQATLAKQLATQLSGQGVKVAGTRGLQVTRSGGYVPTATKLAEVVGAQAGGYSPGRVVPSPVGGVMNTAEDVKYIPGFAQPFINPPAGSKAGRAHRQNSINRTGVDPYMFNGFMPNFSKTTPIKTLSQNKVKSTGLLKNLYDFDKPTDLYNNPEYKIDRFSLPFTSKEYDNIAQKYIDRAIKYKQNIGNFKYRNIELSKFLSLKFNQDTLSNQNPISKRNNLSNIKGALGEIDTYKYFEKEYYQAEKMSDAFGMDFAIYDDESNIERLVSLIETKTTKKLVPDETIIAKTLTYLGQKGKYKNNSPKADEITLPSELAVFQPKDLSTNNIGFIPNFAPPTSAIRVPWFKKFANPAFDAIQPTLGISRASDVDTFGSNQFRSKAFKKAATDGDPNIFGPLYEDFGTKALQLVNQPNIFGELISGSELQPKTIGSQTAFDRALKQINAIIGLDFKAFRKKNLSGGSIAKHMTDKYNRVAQTDPEQAAKIKEAIMVFNEPGHENQLPSEFGKNFLSLAGTSYSQMLKNSPDLVKELSAETNMLLNRYVKNPAFLAMNAAKGFIPNFNYNDIALDALTRKLGREGAISQDLIQFVIDLKNQKYAMGDGFHREIVAKNFGEIVTDEELSNPKNANTYLKGSYDKNSGKTIFYKSFAQSMLPGKLFESKHPYIQTVQNELKSRFAKRQASAPVKQKNFPPSQIFRNQYPGPSPDNHFNNGFIPNFARVKSYITRVVPNTYKPLVDTKGTAFGNTNIGISRQKNISSNPTDEEVLSQAELYYPNLIMSLLGNNAFIPDTGEVDAKTAGANVLSAARKVSSYGDITGNRSDQYNPFSGGSYKSNPELIGSGFVQGKALKLSYANVGKLGRRWENSKNPAVKDAWAKLQIAAKKKLIYNARNLGQGSAFLNENSRRWYIDDINKELRQYSEVLKTEYNAYLKSINRVGTLVDIKGSAEEGLFGKGVSYFAARPDAVSKIVQGLPSFDWKNAADGIFYGDFKNNEEKYRRLAALTGKEWKFKNNRMFLQSGGFIPNFAYKQAVMGLEESMSGNKAIFDTKPFPHIRNSSQPTFSSAISDHGGLSNALSDSMRGQKNAGLMNKGFVPNFAVFGPSYPYLPSGNSSGANTGSSNYYPSGNPTQSQPVSPTFKPPTAATNVTFKPEDIDKAIKNFINSVQMADEKLSVFESTFGGRTKIISSELTKLKNNLSKSGVSGAELNNAMNSAAKEIKGQQSKFAKGLEKSSTTLAFAGPMAAGLIEQAVYGNKQRTEMTSGERIGQSALSSGLSSLTTGASIGASFGPWGAAIGAAAGAAVGLAQALGAASLSADEFAKIAEEYKSATQQNVSAGQSYIDNLKTLGSSTDPEIIKKASTSLELNFKNIKDVKLQDAFKAAGNDVDKLTKALSTYEQKRGRIEAQKSSLAQSKALGGLDIKDLGKRGYATVKSGPRNAIDIAANEANFSMMASEYSTFFDNVDSLTDNQYKQFKEALNTMELSTGNVDEANLRKVLMTFSQLDTESVDYLVGIGENITEVGSTAGRVLRNNLDKVREAYKKNLEKGKGVLSPEERLIFSTFAEFRRNLLNTLSDDLNDATQALKSFDSGTSLAQLVPTKLKEINDLVSNSILNNLDAVRGFSFKQAQAKTTAQFQTQEFNRLTTRTVQEQGLKTTQANTLFKSQATQAILGTNIKPGIDSQTAIKDFLSKGASLDKQGIKTFVSGLVGQESKGEIETLSSKLEGILIQFKESTREIESQTKYKLQEISYNQVINKLNEITVLKQIDLEKEKLKITLGQKDAANGLRDAVEKSKIAANERLELTRIQTGGEFRYLGLNKRQEFESRQVDLKSIFDQEQVIAENQAIADARRSIIEIAAQNANTEAQNKNTEALFDSIDSNSINFENLGNLLSNLPIAGMKEVGSGFVSGAQEAKAKNKFNREQFKQSRESIQFAKLSNFGVQDNSTVGDTIAKLRTKMKEENITEEAKISIQETITTLEIASKQIGSNATIFQAKSAQMRRDFEQSAGFVNNMAIGFKNLGKEADEMVDQLGRNLPGMFADGLVDGIKAAIRESDNLGEALMGIAAKFLDEISTTLMRAGVRNILSGVGFGDLIGGLTGNQKGGYIRAQSGMYISGSGSGDKYPAMLENGEYVLNRRAVMAMGGPAALDTLNFSMAPRFASGGSFNAELDDIKAMEDGMTTFGLENSSYYKELRDAEIERAEQARQKKRAKQAQTAQMVGSLVASVATVAVGAGLQNVASNMQAKAAEKMVQSGTGAIASAGLAAYNDTPQLYAETGLSKAEVSNFQKYVKSGYISPTGMSTIRTPRTGFGSILPPKVRGIQTGGLIGSRLSDTIPGYMEGGLYNSPIVKQYGAGMQGGGMSSVANNSNTVNNTNANNSFNFNTSVNRDGTIQMGADSSTYKQQDVELSNNLNTKIYGAVLDVIREQQRFGGSLAGTRKA